MKAIDNFVQDIGGGQQLIVSQSDCGGCGPGIHIQINDQGNESAWELNLDDAHSLMKWLEAALA